MTYQVLARKWRPRRFDEVVGQPHVVRALRNALDSDRLHHAYLFTGTRGVGKTTIARIFAKSVNCEQGVSSAPCGVCSTCVEVDSGRCVDLIEVDAASRTKVDETRELMDNVQYAPTRARYKVYLIDEVHMFSNHSFNALLKTLEEPPPHVKFLLATTDPKRLPITVLSRCLQFNLTRVPVSVLQDHLIGILKDEQVAHDESSIHLIAAAADGSVRDALSLLDQAIAYGGGALTGQEVAAMLGTVSSTDVHAMVQAIAQGDGSGLLRVARALAEGNPDHAQILGEILSLLRRISVCQVLGAEAASVENDANVLDLAARLTPEDAQLYYQIGLIGRRDLPFAPDPQVGLEMALIRMLAFRPGDAATISPESKTRNRPAPVPAPARPDRSTAAAAAGPLPVAALTADGWRALIDELHLTGLPRELALNCAWVNLHDHELSLALDPQFERLHNPKYVERLAQALRDRFGAALKLKIDCSAGGAAQSPSAQQAAAVRERQLKAELAIEADTTVRALRDAFGASVEDISAR